MSEATVGMLHSYHKQLYVYVVYSLSYATNVLRGSFDYVIAHGKACSKIN